MLRTAMATLAALAFAVPLITLSETRAAQVSQAISNERGDRRICRSMEETGKLAARRRVCMTKAEWDRVAEEQRRVVQTWVTAIDSCRDRANGGSQC